MLGVRRRVLAWLDRPACAIRVRLTTTADGRLLYAVEAPERFRGSLLNAYATAYPDVEVRPAEGAGSSQGQALSGEALEKEIWQALKTCYDPEIPVNIVDLGLIYDMHVDKLADGARIEVKMTLTAQGCGMGTSIAADARNKLLDLPGIVEADVQVVWDPPWTPEKISPEGRALLGIH